MGGSRVPPGRAGRQRDRRRGLRLFSFRQRHAAAAVAVDFAVYGMQLMAPPIILGAMLGAVVNLRPGPAPALIAIYLLAGGVLAFDALRWDRADQRGTMPILERTLRSVRVAMFSAVWLVAVPGALLRIAFRRGRPRFDKTARAGASG